MNLAQITNITPPVGLKFKNSDYLIGDVISRLLLFAIGIGGFYFLARFVIAAYTLLTALGNPEKVQSAQKAILNALIGLLIIIVTFFIFQIADRILGIRTTY